MNLPKDIEADVDIAHIDIKFDDEVVACLTIEVRQDLVDQFGSANNWKKIFEETIEKYSGIVPLMDKIQ